MKNQRTRILEYLKENKSATGLELLKHCGVICYTKRISELREILPDKGYYITDKFVKVKTRYNGVQRVKEYTLTRIKTRIKKK